MDCGCMDDGDHTCSSQTSIQICFQYLEKKNNRIEYTEPVLYDAKAKVRQITEHGNCE